MKEISISKWKNGAKLAFVWGIGGIGNIGNKRKIDHTDWGMHFAKEESFFQKEFLPLIEEYPKIKFTIGAWLGEYDGATDKSELKNGTVSLKPFTNEWKKWIETTIKPIDAHDQIEIVAHGLGHEDWIKLNVNEKKARVRKIQRIFKEFLDKKCPGFNTRPYGTIPRFIT